MKQVLAIFEDKADEQRAIDLELKVAQELGQSITISLQTKDGRDVAVYHKPFLNDLDAHGIHYRLVGLDEMKQQMEPDVYHTLEMFMGVNRRD